MPPKRIHQDPDRSTRFIVVIHDPSLVTGGIISGLVNTDILTYAVVGHELGQQQMTPHDHIYCITKDRMRVNTFRSFIQQYFPTAHVEACYADDEANKKYAMKEGDYEIFGIDPAAQRTESYTARDETKKDRHVEAIELAKQRRMQEIPADLRLRHYRALIDIRDEIDEPTENLNHQAGVWIWGPVGTGKTVTTEMAVAGEFWKKPQNAGTQWWDMYHGEPYVIIDELSISRAKSMMTDLKIWAGPQIFTAETKGGSKTIRPRAIIVTCNWAPSEIYRGIDLQAILKRFKVIHFTKYREFSAHQLRAMIDDLTPVFKAGEEPQPYLVAPGDKRPRTHTDYSLPSITTPIDGHWPHMQPVVLEDDSYYDRVNPPLRAAGQDGPQIIMGPERSETESPPPSPTPSPQPIEPAVEEEPWRETTEEERARLAPSEESPPHQQLPLPLPEDWNHHWKTYVRQELQAQHDEEEEEAQREWAAARRPLQPRRGEGTREEPYYVD